jgi:hypothetical protein
MVAWIAEDGSKRGIATQLILDDAPRRDPLDIDDGHIPIDLDLAPVGGGAGLVWVEEVGHRGIWYQPLSALGAAVGAPVELNNFAAPSSTVDIAHRVNDGGAIVYSLGIDLVGDELRFQRLAEDGSLRGDEIKIISPPLQAKDAGIAHLGGGYVIAYRALPDGESITQPQIRIVFVTKDGRVSRDAAGRVTTFAVANAERDGSRVHVEASSEGQLLLAFVDGNAVDGTSTLRLIRRSLACPQ